MIKKIETTPKDPTPYPVAVRLPPELMARVKALVPKLKKNKEYQLHRVSENFVLRLCILKGVEELEKL